MTRPQVWRARGKPAVSGWTSGNKGPCGVMGHRGGQGPDCIDLLGRGKEFAFYSKYQWMPVEDFRQKNDTI